MDQRLESWKEIAGFLNRSVTTVQRWERDEGLPVHRHQHDSLGSVYAFTHELEAWRATRAAPVNDGGVIAGDAAPPVSDAAASAEAQRDAPAPASALIRRQQTGRILGLLLVVCVTAVALWIRAAPTSELEEIRLEIATPRASESGGFALSPDGRSIVFHVPIERRGQLWLRSLHSETARPLPGTEGAWGSPFWSPDGRSIGFFTVDHLLKRIDLADGLVRVVADAPTQRGGSWSPSGTIVFATSTGPLYRVSADGGTPVEATRLLPSQTNHRFPHFLPDGERFLFFALGGRAARGVHVGSLASGELRRLTDADAAALSAPPDQLMFVRQGSLWTQRVDFERVALIGDATRVASRVHVHPNTPGVPFFSVSPASGTVAYRPDAGERQLAWFDRSGRRIATLGEPDAAASGALRLSPDGRSLAFRRTVGGNTDIWVMDTARGVPQRATSDPAIEWAADFSPERDRIVFGSDRASGISDLYERPVASTAGIDVLLVQSPEQKAPVDWSADGRYILYTSQSPTTGIDLWALPLFGDRKPWAVAQTRYSDGSAVGGAELSPNSRWLAHQSNETGRDEIYVQAFPGRTGQVRVSAAGGSAPHWREDGRELFYVAPDRRLMSASISPNGSTLRIGEPAALFAMPPQTEDPPSYAPSADGQRFLLNTLVAENSTITIVLNRNVRER